jgi:hypothetical protein
MAWGATWLRTHAASPQAPPPQNSIFRGGQNGRWRGKVWQGNKHPLNPVNRIPHVSTVPGASENWIWILVGWLRWSPANGEAVKRVSRPTPGTVPITVTASRQRPVLLTNGGSKNWSAPYNSSYGLRWVYGAASLVYCYSGDRSSVPTAGRLLRLLAAPSRSLLGYTTSPGHYWAQPVSPGLLGSVAAGTVRDLISPSPRIAWSGR